ncbi:hypothetical protein F0L74_29550 [Chitinophaga agrisoli]|uniref:ApeA N-terminal domain-containing protein n=1 Tax=Chitinophaga agrisoli TaxID=2607653 RepID=A0A5B2VQD0_9BACT|nr:hypothetical protein [Chitinophaga agrisoli]KAA2240309.1 hypothetical protein F0L74_29550 [Chitinophaga agrisoli]
MKGEYNGEWFLLGGSKHDGQLTIDDEAKDIKLEIIGAEFIEGGKVDSGKFHPKHLHQIILGSSSNKITLYNCQLAGYSKLGRSLYLITYQVEYVFLGVHFKEDSIPVRSGTFIFPHLSAWYDGENSLNKLEGKQGLFINGNHIIQDALTNDEIKVNEELTLILWDKVMKHIEQMNVSYKVTYEKYARFQYDRNVGFERLLRDGITFLKLLSFLSRKASQLYNHLR